jgi:magnesium transporter
VIFPKRMDHKIAKACNNTEHLLMLTAYPVSSTVAATDPAQRPFWIDLLDPTPEELARVCSGYDLQVPSRAQLEEIEQSSRLRSDGRFLYMSMPLAVHVNQEDIVAAPVGFVLSSMLLVTVRFTELYAFTNVAARVAERGDIRSSGQAFIALLEDMVDKAADRLEKIARDLTAISRVTFRTPARTQRSSRVNQLLRETLRSLGGTGEVLSNIRETLLGLQRIVDFAGEAADAWLERDIRLRLKTVHNDLVSIADFELHLSEKVHFLLDAVLGFINTEQNDMFKVLTIASVVGIPPTLIASMYGMNFHNMPELAWRWGYAYGLVLIALSTIIPVLWFKRRGWW